MPIEIEVHDEGEGFPKLYVVRLRDDPATLKEVRAWLAGAGFVDVAERERDVR